MKRSSLHEPRESLRMLQTLIRKPFTRYLIVSGTALGLDVLVFTTLFSLELASMTLASCVGYLSGLWLSFILSKRFVFKMDLAIRSVHGQWLLFIITGCAGLATTGILTFLLERTLGAYPVPIKGVSVLISFVLVYLLRKLVFSNRTHDRIPRLKGVVA